MSGRVAVLGGGASGLSFAAAMKELGHRRVTVFEAATRVGGKSCTVDIEGRPHDLGATMGVPVDYRDVLRLSRRAGVATEPFPRQRHYCLTRGGEIPLNRWREIPRVLVEAARYFRLHASWKGVDGSGLHRAGDALHRPWSEIVREHGLDAVNRRTLTYRAGYGYGFDDEVPAVMYANLFRPETFFGLLVEPAFLWRGGTQQIWERVARELDVRTATPITRVERDAHGVTVHAGGKAERFDSLVVTINPKDALAVLDATDEERGWFSQVKTYPYSTFACEVLGLTPGRSSVGYIDENMKRGREGHPMAWVKRYADRDHYVVHLFAPESLSDDAIASRIAGDLGRLGGRLVRVHATRRWQFFPHFPTSFMQAGGLAQIERWQGRSRTYLIGEVLSFASMARVTTLARRMAVRVAAQPATHAPSPAVAAPHHEVA